LEPPSMFLTRRCKRDPTIINIQECEKSLLVPHSGPCPVDKWMVMPAMAGPIANELETAVFFFSPLYSHTALPHFCGRNN
ncbi:hypothetical protein VP01_2316g1, partial [Puccinia sorghi]